MANKPKSVVKVKYKNGQTSVVFTDFSDQASYYIDELSRGALSDVNKYLKRIWKIVYYEHFTKRTGNAGKNVYGKVFEANKTDEHVMKSSIGFRKGGKKGFYAYFQEFGTSKTPRLGLLTHAVMDNVATIKEIESKYLTALNGGESTIDSLINEMEYETDDNE